MTTIFESATRKTLALSIMGLLAFSAPAAAFGGGDDGNGGTDTGGGASGNSNSGPARCGKGLVWDKKAKRCVRAQSSGLPDHELLRQGLALALSGRFEDALIVLDAVRNKQDAMVLTYIGYSHRKMGETDIGIGYYRQALAIDPNSLNTHEYLGEGYASAGRMELAKAELLTVEKLCGSRSCEQYEDLAAAVAGTPRE